MTADLVAFIRERYDEDEQVARDAVRWSEGAAEWADAGEPDWLHIARHDPARVLREVEAKRRIIDWHDVRRDDTTPWGEPVQICWCGYDRPCSTLRLLTLPYADHPEYRDEWRACRASHGSAPTTKYEIAPALSGRGSLVSPGLPSSPGSSRSLRGSRPRGGLRRRARSGR